MKNIAFTSILLSQIILASAQNNLTEISAVSKPIRISYATTSVQSNSNKFTDHDEINKAIGEDLKNRKNYGLFIAVENYKDETINDLDKPVRDAKTLRDAILKGYNFYEQDVLFLENPTRHEIISAFDKLSKEVTEQDNLMIFYAGHGVWDTNLKKGYWLPSDAQKGVRSNWFSNSDLRDYIGGIKSKHTLLVADACFSGGIFKTREAFNSRVDAATFELFKLPSRQAMTSGAMKTVPDESVFLKYLTKRLEENTKPFLSAEELFSTFKTAVINNSANGQVPQFGEIKETGDEGGDFIFIKK